MYREVIEGLMVLSRYESRGLDAWGIAAEHDQLWAGPADGHSVSEADRAWLEANNWHIDDSGRWEHGV